MRVADYGAGRIRPARAHPAGAQGGPPAPDPRHAPQPLPDLLPLGPGDAWSHIEPATQGDPWGEVTDADGTTHRVWRVGDPAVHEAVAAELADSELLIADGHHRYETALTYADEIGGDGPHRYALMCPGLARRSRA